MPCCADYILRLCVSPGNASLMHVGNDLPHTKACVGILFQPCAVDFLQHALPCKAVEQGAASRHNHMAAGPLLQQHQ